MSNNWLTVFGFLKNPYDTKPLSSKEGDELLIGREKETRFLTEKLTSNEKVPLLYGHNGVGKSSIVNVVAYRLSKNKEGNERYFFLERKRISSIQLHKLDVFEKNLYFDILNLLLDEKEFLKQRNIEEQEINEVYKLFDKMEDSRFNPTFLESRIISQTQKWLNKCFGEPYSGGIICVIDNLENSGTSSQVKGILENLRDTLFDIHGLLWVLCGTSAAVKGALASGRLNSCLASIKIEPIKNNYASALVMRRIEYYGKDNADPPVNAKLFEHIYNNIVKSQLRITLSLCEEFAEHLYNYPQYRSIDRWKEFEKWINKMSVELPDKEYEIGKNSWQLFDHITNLAVDVMSTNFSVLGIPSAEKFDNYASPLINKNLLECIEMDDGYIIRVTKDGWLVAYKRRELNYEGEHE